MSGSREWDAGTYDRVSGPQLEWGTAVVADLELGGGETVLDAGCGSGRVSELVLERLDPAAGGQLIGVDGSAAMVEQARKRLGPGVTLIHSDLLELELPEPVDAVLSTATFHWILDHDRLWERVAGWLRPGGRLRVQCGGEGNVARFLAACDAVAAEQPWAAYLADLPPSRYFAGAEETAERLRRSGFTDVECWLEPRNTQPKEPREFIGTVCLGVHTDALPVELRDPFIDAVYERWGPGSELDYVRLNVRARRA